MGTKKAFFESLELMKDLGACPWCWKAKLLAKSNINSFHCCECARTFTIENDKVIVTYYVYEHGRRVLNTHELNMEGRFWENFIEQINKHRNY